MRQAATLIRALHGAGWSPRSGSAVAYSAISLAPTYRDVEAVENLHIGYFVIAMRRTAMGKYFLAWLLGVPAFVLVLVYMFMH